MIQKLLMNKCPITLKLAKIKKTIKELLELRASSLQKIILIVAKPLFRWEIWNLIPDK
jgi:hypothetical protein